MSKFLVSSLDNVKISGKNFGKLTKLFLVLVRFHTLSSLKKKFCNVYFASASLSLAVTGYVFDIYMRESAKETFETCVL